ncbi:invasion associated locus B family protein [Pontibaca salina]|uniref:Invasion associated locus B family protein n=1 Tax=Pontibaca salina TaxID=2795731 RepID=A0A934HNY4_9RHOB|nr:invasion associated locus B family protein [Pontibaca salina]MBI6629072.1 invasion associated locus B family protein [Pontibaca salina]
MLKHISPLSILAVIALTAGAYAQGADTSAADQTTTSEAAPADNSASDAPNSSEAPTETDAQLDLGQPVPSSSGEPQLGERYSKQKFGDWDLACIKTEMDKDPCSLLQILRDDNDNAVAEISLFRIAGQGQAVAGASVVVPLETLLPAQLTISVDQAAGKRYNYSFCTEMGCVAQIGLTQEDINAFKRGKAATVALRPAPAPDQEVELTMSLNGFTAGFDAVDVVEQ